MPTPERVNPADLFFIGDIPLTGERDIWPRQVRTTFANRFRELYNQGLVKNGIRDITIMGYRCRDHLRRLGFSNQQLEQLNLTIGDIDVRGFPDPTVAQALGIDPRGRIAAEMREYESQLLTTNFNSHDPSLWGYQAEAIGWELTRYMFCRFINAYGADFTPPETVLAYGSLSAIDNIYGAVFAWSLNTTQKVSVLFPTPGFSVIADQASRRGIEVIPVPTDPDTNYAITREQIETFLPEVTDERTILCLTPLTNPTSTVTTSEIVEEVATAFVERRPEGFILVDLAYVEMIPDDVARKILASLLKSEYHNHLILVVSMSKLFADPGLRAGAIYTKNAHLWRQLQIQWQTVFASISRPTQLETIAKWTYVTREARKAMFAVLKQRQDQLVTLLTRINDMRTQQNQPPLVDLNRVLRDNRLYIYTTLYGDIDFLKLFEEAGVLGIPGEVFRDQKEHNAIRFSLGMEAFDEYIVAELIGN